MELRGVLSLFLPAAHGPRQGQTDAVQTALLLLIEFAGNVLGFSLLFAVPVGVLAVIRLSLAATKERPLLSEERP